MKSNIMNLKTELVSYGHWRITILADNPALLLSDDDWFWNDNDKEGQPDKITLTHTTTDSKAVDGQDGGNRLLAEECIRANGWDVDLFDLSTIQ